MMKSKTISSIAIEQSENLRPESEMQQADENKICKQSKCISLPIICMCLSLLIIIIPIIWVVVMCNAGDDKIVTESSDLDINYLLPRRYGSSLDYSRASDKFGYQVDSGKITEYRNLPSWLRKIGPT